MTEFIAPPVQVIPAHGEKKDPIRVGPTKKGNKLTMYCTLPFVVSGMNIQHRNIGELRRLVGDKVAWASAMSSLRQDLEVFFADANVKKTLEAWGIA